MLLYVCCSFIIFFFKQKSAYELRISDWISDVGSSDLLARRQREARARAGEGRDTDHPARQEVDAAARAARRGAGDLSVELPIPQRDYRNKSEDSRVGK